LLARSLLGSAEDQLQDTIVIFRALRQEAEAANNYYLALRFATFLSEALLAADEPGEAAHVFQEVLSLAAPAGLSQSIWMEARRSGRCYYAFKKMRDAPEFPASSCFM
jgi:hypothetical protein